MFVSSVSVCFVHDKCECIYLSMNPHTLHRSIYIYIYEQISPVAATASNDPAASITVLRYSAAANEWTTLAPSGTAPTYLDYLDADTFGFAATPDGKLYAFLEDGDEHGCMTQQHCLNFLRL